MWITEEEEKIAQDALGGTLTKHGESYGYIKGLYCPRCGAQRVHVDFTHCYICNGYNRSVGQELERYVVCNQCRHGFIDSEELRWSLRCSQYGNNLSGDQPIILELLNPHDWRKNRQLVRETMQKFSKSKSERSKGEFRSKEDET